MMIPDHPHQAAARARIRTARAEGRNAIVSGSESKDEEAMRGEEHGSKCVIHSHETQIYFLVPSPGIYFKSA